MIKYFAALSRAKNIKKIRERNALRKIYDDIIKALPGCSPLDNLIKFALYKEYCTKEDLLNDE